MKLKVLRRKFEVKFKDSIILQYWNQGRKKYLRKKLFDTWLFVLVSDFSTQNVFVLYTVLDRLSKISLSPFTELRIYDRGPYILQTAILCFF